MPVPPRSEWTIYQALWRAAEAQGAFVCYTDRDDGFEGGMFHVFNGSPRILVVRPFFKVLDKPTRGRHPRAPRDMPAPNILEELFVLAHQLGHLASWREDPKRTEQHWSALQRLKLRTMTGPIKRRRSDLRLLDEESRAWDFAATILEREGFDGWPAFKAFRRRALDSYVHLLGRTHVRRRLP